MRRVLTVLLLAAFALAAAPKKTTAAAKGENEDLILTVTLHIDPQEIQQLVGSDLEGHFFVAEVRVDPKYGKEVAVDPDDFVLRTDKNGEHTKPYVASQVAGKNVMTVALPKENKPRTSFGIGGAMGDIGVGGDSAEKPPAKVTVQVSNDEQDNPLEKTLDQKMLPRKKTEEPVSGLLYFPMEKQRMKDLELRYGGQENRITLRFR
jgi:hypothetical protein